MSRTALDGFPVGDVEKDYLLDTIKLFGKLYFVDILGFALMGNHLLCEASNKKCWTKLLSQ
jgi:putative transposase